MSEFYSHKCSVIFHHDAPLDIYLNLYYNSVGINSLKSKQRRKVKRLKGKQEERCINKTRQHVCGLIHTCNQRKYNNTATNKCRIIIIIASLKNSKFWRAFLQGSFSFCQFPDKLTNGPPHDVIICVKLNLWLTPPSVSPEESKCAENTIWYYFWRGINLFCGCLTPDT